MFSTPTEVAAYIASHARAKRLSLNLSQLSLSERSAVSLGVLKKFERTAKISLESLLKIAMALGCLEEFLQLFRATPIEAISSLDQLLEKNIRQRGRK